MSMDVTFKLNNTDWASKLSTYSTSREVSYRYTITTLDGMEHAYPAAPRPIITFSLYPLTSAEIVALYDILSQLIISVTYTDPASSTDVTRNMRLTSNIDSIFALKSVDGKIRYKGGEITLRAV